MRLRRQRIDFRIRAGGQIARLARSFVSLSRRPFLWVPLLLIAGFALGWGRGSWRNLCADCPSIAQIATWEPQQTSKLYSADGQLIAELGIERRTPVSIAELPRWVPQAFIAVEDRRFYSHGGIDPRGLGRAVFQALTTFSLSGGGGSTITQQLARNMFASIGFEKRITRKLKEAQVALLLEQAYEKDQILEAYMNQVNLDVGYGIQTASRNYFGKNATEINPAEAALLAAVANIPRVYNPFRRPENALRRRNLVLDRMVREGFLPESELEQWKAWPIPTERPDLAIGVAPYFEEWVRQILQDRFGNQLYTGGLQIWTTLDVGIQRAAERAMEAGFTAIEARPGFPHSKYEEFAESDQPLPGANAPYLQGALIALDPQTGAVRAMIGGRDFNHSKFNRAVQARRQPGSSFKPFVFAAGLASGIPASHVIVDSPFSWMQVDSTEWRPSNFDDEFGGPMTLRDALARSVNMVAIKLGWDEVGIQTVVQTARRMGIRSPIPPVPSTTIGAAELTPLELTEGYASFATLGTRTRAFPIVRVENAAGEVLWEPRPERGEALDRSVARIAVSMLEDVVNRGTGYSGVRLHGGIPRDIEVGGKTGTTNDFTNVWFAGFTANLVATVWFGMDQPATLYQGATGGADAAPVWGSFMREVYFGNEEAGSEPLLPRPEPWGLPADVVTLMVDRSSGKRASEWCPADQAYMEYFVPGTEPRETCDRQAPSLFRIPR